MYIDQTTMLFIWLGIIILTLIIEIITQGLTTIWFSIGAAVAAISNNWELNLWIQIAIFCVVSILFMILARPFAQRMMRSTINPTNLDQLKENIQAFEIDLSEEILKAIEDIHRQQPNPAP